MESTPWHPVLVHFPMALSALLPLVAGGILLAWWRDYFQKRTWAVVVGLQLVMLASSLLASHSGEEDEHRVEEVLSEDLIEHHEKLAELFTWATGLVLILCVLPLLLRKLSLARASALLAWAGTLAVLGLGYRVGAAGGELVYRHGAAAAFTTTDDAGPNKPAPQRRRHRDDDDDDH